MGTAPGFRARNRRSNGWRRNSAPPSGPTSLKPAEMMIAPRTPTSTHSPTTVGTVGAGVTITAKSTRSGTAATSVTSPSG